MFVGSVYYFEPEAHNIRFNGDKEQLYRTHFVALPDNTWYSEEPYIDHQVRTERFFRLVERIREADVPLGSFANFTANRRKTHRDRPGWQTEPEAAAAAIADAPSAAPPEPRVLRAGDRFYLAADAPEETRQLLEVYAAPRLLRSYKGYNLVGYGDAILAAPIVLGRMDLTAAHVASDLRILRARTEDDACRLVDMIEAAATMAQEVAMAQELERLAAADAAARTAADEGGDVPAIASPVVGVARKPAAINMGAGVLMRWGK
jgi:hypothetical protein